MQGSDSDVDAMIKGSGEVIYVGEIEEKGYGIVDKYDRSLYETGVTTFPGRSIRVITRDGAFATDIQDGTMIIIDGSPHKVIQTRKRVDGSIVESFVVLQEDMSMTEAQTRALIESYLKKADFSRWDHSFEYGTSGTLPFTGTRAINNASNKKHVDGFALDTNTGVNLCWLAGRGYHGFTNIPIDDGQPHAFSPWSPFYFSMRLGRGTDVGSAVGEKLHGIGWGDLPTVNTPWATNIGLDPFVGQTIQLRYNYTIEAWETMTYANDSNPPVITPCSYQPPFIQGSNYAELAIDWDGINFRMYLNRVLAFTVSAAESTRVSSSTVSGNAAYIFWTNGQGSGSKASEAGFFQGHIFQPLPIPGNTNQSYVP